MKKILIAGLSLCAFLGAASCSAPEKEEEGEKGRIEEFTDDVAHDATNAIRRPIDRARNVQELSRKRNEEIPQE